MKKSLLLLGLVSLFAFTSCQKDEINKASEPALETTSFDHQVVTLADIQAIYGENISVENGKLDPNTPIYWQGDLKEGTLQKSLCGTQLYPCAAIPGLIKSVYQSVANDCCCVFAVGAECCLNGQLGAVFVLVTPNSPSCGIIAL